MESNFLIVGAIAIIGAIANPTLNPLNTSPANSRVMANQTQTTLRPGECICAEYVARRAGMPNVNEVSGSAEGTLQSAGYHHTAYPRPGGIALLAANIPGLTKPDSGHIAFVESVDDGIPIVTDSNSGGTDNGYGCTNVRTAKRENYYSPGVTFWAKN